MTAVGFLGGPLLRRSGWRLRRSIATSGHRKTGPTEKIKKDSPTERRSAAERATGKANEKHLMEKALYCRREGNRPSE